MDDAIFGAAMNMTHSMLNAAYSGQNIWKAGAMSLLSSAASSAVSFGIGTLLFLEIVGCAEVTRKDSLPILSKRVQAANQGEAFRGITLYRLPFIGVDFLQRKIGKEKNGYSMVRERSVLVPHDTIRFTKKIMRYTYCF